MDPVTGMVVAKMFGKAIDKAVDHLTDDAIDAGQGASGRLVAWVRRKFSGTKELERVEDAPDSRSRVKALGEAIENHLANNKGDSDEISALVTQVQMQQSARNVNGNRILIIGDGSIIDIKTGDRSPVTFGGSSPESRAGRHARD